MHLCNLKNSLSISALALVAGISSSALAQQASFQTEIIPVTGVTLEDNVTPVDVNLTVFSRNNGRCDRSGGTLVTLHGFTFNASSWAPLAETLFAPGPNRSAGICRMVSIDMPGHGTSINTDPNVDLDDYVGVLDQVLAALPGMDLAGDHLMGHSMGGGLVWMLQDQLVAEGSSIEQEYGISETTLVAPVPPDEVGWGFAYFARASLFNSFFVQNGFLAAPQPTWSQFFFGGLNATTTPVRPLDSELANWLSPEPLGVGKQMFGYVGDLNLSPAELQDPSIFGGLPSAAPGIFAPTSGETCAVNVVGYEGDSLISLDEVRATYEHLTGDTTGRCLTELTGATSVHETHIADPERFATEILAPGARLGLL